MTREEIIEKYVIPACERTWNEKTCKQILDALDQKPTTEVLQEIREELEKLKITVSLSKACFTKDQIDTYRAAANNALSIIDKHIKEIEHE